MTATSIPEGLSEEGLVEFVGDDPAMVSYPQDVFWNVETLPGDHAVSLNDGAYHDPYMNRGGSWRETRGIERKQEQRGIMETLHSSIMK